MNLSIHNGDMRHHPYEGKHMIKYHHTQIGYLVMIASAIGLLSIAGSMAAYGFYWIVFAVLIITGVCLVLFATLTIVIEEDLLEVRFGIGELYESREWSSWI